jgi:hypothetical protein
VLGAPQARWLGPIDQFVFEEDDVLAAAREGEDGVQLEVARIGGVTRHIQRDPDPEEVNRQLEPLFGSVIPFHPAKPCAYFEGCLSHSVELSAAASFPAANRPLEELGILHVTLESSYALMLATMCRSSVKVTSLMLRHTGLNVDGCKAVCDGIHGNRHLTGIDIVESRLKPRADTFTGLVRKGSLLEYLAISFRLDAGIVRPIRPVLAHKRDA